MRFDYRGLKIESAGNAAKPVVKVFRNSCFLRPLHVTTSLDLAMKWADSEVTKTVPAKAPYSADDIEARRLSIPGNK